LPWKLVYAETFEELIQVRKYETQNKKKMSRKYIEALIGSVKFCKRFNNCCKNLATINSANLHTTQQQ
jgi:hypothetical protein